MNTIKKNTIVLAATFSVLLPVASFGPTNSVSAQEPTPASTKPSDAVPDWLKEYDKPKGSGTGSATVTAGQTSGAGTIPPANANTTTVPAGFGLTPATVQPAMGIPAATSGAAPVTTSLGPITPIGAVARPIQRATMAPVQSAPKAPVGMLRGRLEEVGGVGARLPVGLSLKGLKAEVAHEDTSVLPPKQLQSGASATSVTAKAAAASFPVDWRGSFGGPLTIHDSQIDTAAWTADREEAAQIQQIMQRGVKANATFNFSQDGRKISLEPAKLVFPARKSKSSQREIEQALSSSGMGSMFGGANGNMLKSMISGMNTSIPVMYLGELAPSRGVAGNEISAVLLKNNVKQLKEGVLEQDLIVRLRDKSAAGVVQMKISETVLRFTKLNQSQLYVQAAQITYRNDGHFLEKVLFYGTVTRGAGGGDPTMMGLPGLGGLPGMSPSGAGGGMGGLDAINQMMKQLQGN